MFREMRRFKQQISEDQCKEVLKHARRAVLSVNGEDGYPFAVPVNFYYDEQNNKIYFHGAKAGHKIDALKKDNKVCFTVWDEGYKVEGDWAYYVNSVVIFGKAHFIEDEDFEILRKISKKYIPTVEETEATIARAGARVQTIEIVIEDMKGKLVHEK